MPTSSPTARISRSSRPAAFPRAVVLACDGNHLPYALFAAHRIEATEPGRAFDLCLCLPEDTPLPQGTLPPWLRLCLMALPDLSAWRRSYRVTTAAYMRAFLPACLGDDYGRILYVDTDVYIARSGLNAVFDHPLGDAILGAVPDLWTLRPPRHRRRLPYLHSLGLTDGRYFNSGVLLLDTAACRSFDLAGRMTAAIDSHGHMFRTLDQCPLNLACAGRVAWMSLRWNWPFRQRLAPALDRIAPVLLHFLGPDKPWLATQRPHMAPYHAEYAAFLGRHFPEHRIAANPLDAARRPLHRLLDRVAPGRGGPLAAALARQSWWRKLRYVASVYGQELG